jgi:iron complex outermembrane receptor protein
MKQTPVAFALALLSMAIGQAYAQQAPAAADPAKAEDDQKAQVVTITTGTRSVKAIDKIPGAVTVVSKQELEHTQALTEDATAVLARTVPGYSESSQAMANNGENLRGRIALRLFDGVPQGSPLREGSRSATFTDMGLIGRIEVINGPSASEGIGAAGGIINYISKVPTKMGSEFTLNTRYTTQFEDDSAGWKVGLNFAHKSETFDLLAGISRIDRGISYSGDGRRIGLHSSGSTSDSVANTVFVKGGFNFGQGNEQRIQASVTKFKIEGKGNYRNVDGSRGDGIPATAERPSVFGTLTEINDFTQGLVSYSHGNLLGGVFTLDAYAADQAMRFPAESGSDRADPLIPGPRDQYGDLIDQSEVAAKKSGLRTSFARQDAFGVGGLELRGGLDLTRDQAQQRLALSDRLWVPPMNYSSTAPWVQASYDIGPVTLSAGLRREDGKLQVDSYTTVFSRNRTPVEGGTLSYTSNLPNLGLVWRLPAGWSVFAATGKGFTLPNLGIPLRNVSTPGQSVTGIIDLQAIVVKNDEVGFNWRGAMGALSGSYYHSFSTFGQTLLIDPATRDFILRRLPVDIKGIEFSGELKLSKSLRASATYSHVVGKTEFVAGGPLDKQLGVLDVSPDKINVSGTWKPTPQSSVTLGATTLKSRDINVGQANEEHTKGYTLVDMSAKYDLGRWGGLTLGVENLLNKQYELNFSQVSGSFLPYLAGRGRVVSISHEIKF